MLKVNGSVFGMVVLVSVLGGCGGSGGSVSTGLPRDTQLKSLTAAELKTACVNTLKSQPGTSDAAIRGGCASKLGGQGVAACNAGLEACVTQGKAAAATRTDPSHCDQPSATDTAARFASCSATVAELEDCLSEYLDSYDKTASTLTCASPIPPAGFDPTSGPACTALKSKCPDVIGSMVSVSSG